MIPLGHFFNLKGSLYVIKNNYISNIHTYEVLLYKYSEIYRLS
jgi:hypothetical protein